MRPEIEEAIKSYKRALTIAKGQDFAENTRAEYSRGWFTTVHPDGTSLKYRLAQIEAATRNLRTMRGSPTTSQMDAGKEQEIWEKAIRDRKSARSKKQKTDRGSATSMCFQELTEFFASVWGWVAAHRYWTIFSFPILIMVILAIFDPNSLESPRKTTDGGKLPEYCVWPGCTNRPSEFWADRTGYCSIHIQKALELQKLREKASKQGY